MEKEKIPAYRVIETLGLVCVAEFNFSEFCYKGISLGECLAETQNFLYLKEGKTKRKLVWLSDDKEDYFFVPDVEIATFIDNMALRLTALKRMFMPFGGGRYLQCFAVKKINIFLLKKLARGFSRKKMGLSSS